MTGRQPRPNRYPENPHPPGTLLAAQWDFGRSVELAVEAGVVAVRRDREHLRQLAAAIRRQR